MSLAQLYHISYNGIEAVSAARANELSVGDRAAQPEMTAVYNAQINRLGDMAEDVITQTIAGGLVVNMKSDKVHDAYDVLFGSGKNVQPKSADIIQFPQTTQASALQNAFGQSAAKFRAGIDFSRAAGMVAANKSAPALERTLEAA